jgi:nucleoside-diphosphate-sugar epimerase
MCFIKQIIEHDVITLHSSGKQTRNFISTDQVGDLILNVLTDFPRGFSTINACSRYHSTILKIAKSVASSGEKILNRKMKVSVKGTQPLIGNVFRYTSNCHMHPADCSDCEQVMLRVIDNLITSMTR